MSLTAVVIVIGQFKHQTLTPMQVCTSVATLHCNTKVPMLTFDCNVVGAFGMLSRENSRVITV